MEFQKLHCVFGLSSIIWSVLSLTHTKKLHKGSAQFVYPKDGLTTAVMRIKKNRFIPDDWGIVIKKSNVKKKKS